MADFLGSGCVPDNWAVSRMKCLPKFARASQARDMRPIALQNMVMKWLSTVVVAQLKVVFAQIIPGSQGGFMRGRHMLEHVVSARMEWESGSDRPEQVMVAVDLQKAYDSVSFQFPRVALGYIGFPAPCVSFLLSIMGGPILFCARRGFEPGVEFPPRSRFHQGDPLSPLLFNVVTIFLNYDFGRLWCDFHVLFYGDHILICLPGCKRLHDSDVQALMYVQSIFGFYSGLKVNHRRGLGEKAKGNAATRVSGRHHSEGQVFGVFAGDCIGATSPWSNDSENDD